MAVSLLPPSAQERTLICQRTEKPLRKAKTIAQKAIKKHTAITPSMIEKKNLIAFFVLIAQRYKINSYEQYLEDLIEHRYR